MISFEKAKFLLKKAIDESNTQSEIIERFISLIYSCGYNDGITAQPTYTEAEIQKIQEMEQAEIDKTYQVGYEQGKKDAEPKWIPCSKRLPEDSDYYLVTTTYEDVEQMWFAHKKDYDIAESEWREIDDHSVACIVA
jgi:hypothetical protein